MFAGAAEERAVAARIVQRIYDQHQGLKKLAAKGRITKAMAERHREFAKLVQKFLDDYRGTIRPSVESGLRSVVVETPRLTAGLGFLFLIFGILAAAGWLSHEATARKQLDVNQTEMLVEASKAGIDTSTLFAPDRSLLGGIKGVVGMLLLGAALWFGKDFLPKRKAA